MPSPASPIPTRAIMPDELRDRLVTQAMKRDRLSKDAAQRVVNGLHPNELVRLEMEASEQRAPSFSADYDPYAR